MGGETPLTARAAHLVPRGAFRKERPVPGDGVEPSRATRDRTRTLGGVGSYGRTGCRWLDDLLLVTQRDHRQWRRIAPACMGGCSSCLGRDHPSWARIDVRRSTVRRLQRGGSLPRIHTQPLGVRIHDRDARCPQQDSNLLLVTSPVTAGPTFRHLARARVWIPRSVVPSTPLLSTTRGCRWVMAHLRTSARHPYLPDRVPG